MKNLKINYHKVYPKGTSYFVVACDRTHYDKQYHLLEKTDIFRIVRIVFTIHAQDKLKSKEIRLLGVKRKQIIEVLRNPLAINKDLRPHQSVGELNEDLSLAVIWKEEDGIIKVITFYPAEKGRYESKILRRR